MNLINHPLYNTYQQMLGRCYNANNRAYKNYGARGITVCDEWKNDILNFIKWAENSNRENGLTLDRINNNKNYCPENCKWSTSKEQNNNRRDNHLILAFGETKNIKQWSEDKRCKTTYDILLKRICQNNWDYEKAILTKSKTINKKYLAFNEEKTLREWSNDNKCLTNFNTLKARILNYKWNIETAIITPSRIKK